MKIRKFIGLALVVSSSFGMGTSLDLENNNENVLNHVAISSLASTSVDDFKDAGDKKLNDIVIKALDNQSLHRDSVHKDAILSTNKSSMNEKELANYKIVKSVLQSEDMVNLFKDSPKGGNIEIMIDQQIAPISVAYKEDKCIVQGVLDEHYDFLDKEVPHDLKQDLAFNSKEKELHNELVARHEVSHCRFNDFEHPLILSSNPELNKKMNMILVGDSNSKLIKRVNESFADSLAAIQMLNANPTKDVKNMIMKHAAMRETTDLKESSGAELHEHNDTHKALKILISEEGLQKIAKIGKNDSRAMESLALETANRAVRSSLAELNEHQRGFLFNTFASERSAAGSLGKVILDENKQMFSGTSNVKLLGYINLYDREDSLNLKAAKKYISSIKNSSDYTSMREILLKVGNGTVTHDEEVKYVKLTEKFQDKYVQYTKDILGMQPIDVANQLIMEFNGKQLKNELESVDFNKQAIEAKIDERTKDNIKQLGSSFFKMPTDLGSKLEKLKKGYEGTEDEVMKKIQKLRN